MKKRALLNSIIALILCVSMLVGTTFAWFTDSVTSQGNIIKSGTLDLELYWSDDLNGTWNDVKNAGTNKIFDYKYWEPGYTQVRYIKIVNAGDLAFRYAMDITPNGEVSELADVIDVYTVIDPSAAIDGRTGLTAPVGTLREVISGAVTAQGVLHPNGAAVEAGRYAGDIVLAIALKMREEAGNEYQDKSIGDSFGITLRATQYTYEEDSFGDDYDTDAELPALPGLKGDATGSADVKTENGATVSETTITTNTDVKATVPAGVKVEGEKLSLSVTAKDGSDSNITAGEGEDMAALDVHIEGVSKDNKTPILVELGAILSEGFNQGNMALYHVENGTPVAMTQVLSLSDLDAHNEYYYDPATGNITVAMATFSEVALVAENEKKWEGKFDYTWYDADATELTIANADQLAAFGAIVGGMAKDEEGKFLITYTDSDGDEHHNDSFEGKTVKLISDINLGDKESENNPDLIFYPIGYWNSEGTYEKTGTAISSGFYAFQGTFDGNGNTISNWYQNTWEMKGDHDWYDATLQYYRDGMGLFGRVLGGTIKNLTVDNFSCDSEIGTSGVIAAYADSKDGTPALFENISITNCNPRVYNIGNGGIVGCAGWYSRNESLGNADYSNAVTFRTITVDQTNKISALWGSWGVSCAGILGQYYPNSSCGIKLENCHVAAIIDVNNDVCSNYQYYWYRYAGMFIGTIRANTTDSNGYTVADTTGVIAKDCTYTMGNWNEYWYCEIVANSLASYTHDHQFSRLDNIYDLSEIKSGDTWLKEGHFALLDENRDIVDCYHIFKNSAGELYRHFHDIADESNPNIYETFDLNGDGELNDLKEDRQRYFIPFNQLLTGLDMGIKAHTEFDGITFVENGTVKSEEKFTATNKTEIEENEVVNIDDLFSAKKDVEISSPTVQVYVSPVGYGSTVSATYSGDTADWEKGTLTFSGIGSAKVVITDHFYCTSTVLNVTVGGVVTAYEKFDVVMNNGDFLHRVGNSGTVALDKLFKAKDDVNIGDVVVTVEAVDGTAASGTYTSNATWTNGTIQFNGTGVVKVTITDNDYCTPTELYLEVVDAVNATSATDATSNNVVLLKDISGGFTVSNGWAFYGNGFKVTCSGDGSYRSAAVSYGFVTVENGGILDNVQIICDIFPESYLYTKEMTAGSDGRYPYGYSAVVISGNSTISNSYIYGARNNIQAGEGNVTIENTVFECGSLANIHIKSTSAYEVTLKDVTTIQYQTTSNYDTSKKVLGFGVLVGTNESESNATIILEGDLKQYNWVTSADTSVSNTYAKTAIAEALKVTNYQHTINSTTTVNMGIAVLNSEEITITDERTNKDTVPYGKSDITMSGYNGQVCSITKDATGVSATSRYSAETDGVIPYKANANRVILPVVASNDSNSAITSTNGYNTTTGAWESKVVIDLDNISGGSYTFKFSNLLVIKYGKNLEFTVKDSNGNAVDKNAEIVLNQLTTSNYTLAVTDALVYGANGTVVSSVIHETPFVLSATKTSIDPPKFTNAGTATAIRLVTSSGGDWRPAYTALTGVSVTYWSASESKVKTVDLATLYNSGTISSNVWTYTCDDYTLTITGGAVHSDGTTITPVVANNTLYFASTNKAFGTGTTSRNIILTYVFTDKNASTTWNRSETVKYSDLSEYDYNSFMNNGTLTEPSSGGGCVTPDTLITLADGTQVRVDSLKGDEMLLVWNMETGKLDSAPILFVDSDPEAEFEIVHLYFSDGTDVKVIYEHGFWDYDLNKYVYLDRYAEKYIGHTFAKQNGDSLAKVKLVDVVIETEVTTAWSPVTAGHLCYFVNGVLSMPGGVGGLFNIFDVDPETMTYDYEAMVRDIETYGLFTYEELNAICPLSREMFEAAGGAYLKISIGKGNLTMDELIGMIQRYSKYFN